MDAQLFEDAARILDITSNRAPEDLLWVGKGARTRGLVRPKAHVPHRFGQRSVVVKIYRGGPNTAQGYRTFHGRHFARLPALVSNPRYQQSLEAGVFIGKHPYAVLTYIEGTLLRSALQDGLTPSSATQTLGSLFREIWIPAWSAGLRFKDCHAGNFVVRPDGRLTMIDVEQIRKDAAELLETPSSWTQRDQHEAMALRRVKNLFVNTLEAAHPKSSRAALTRAVTAALSRTKLLERLSDLGRSAAPFGVPAANKAVSDALDMLSEAWS